MRKFMKPASIKPLKAGQSLARYQLLAHSSCLTAERAVAKKPTWAFYHMLKRGEEFDVTRAFS